MYKTDSFSYYYYCYDDDDADNDVDVLCLLFSMKKALHEDDENDMSAR